MSKISTLNPLHILEWLGKKMGQAATHFAAAYSKSMAGVTHALKPKAGH